MDKQDYIWSKEHTKKGTNSLAKYFLVAITYLPKSWILVAQAWELNLFILAHVFSLSNQTGRL